MHGQTNESPLMKRCQVATLLHEMLSIAVTWLRKRAPRTGQMPQLSHCTPWCTWRPCLVPAAAMLLRALLLGSVFCALLLPGSPMKTSGH